MLRISFGDAVVSSAITVEVENPGYTLSANFRPDKGYRMLFLSLGAVKVGQTGPDLVESRLEEMFPALQITEAELQQLKQLAVGMPELAKKLDKAIWSHTHEDPARTHRGAAGSAAGPQG